MLATSITLESNSRSMLNHHHCWFPICQSRQMSHLVHAWHITLAPALLKTSTYSYISVVYFKYWYWGQLGICVHYMPYTYNGESCLNCSYYKK